jgi:hypothetical protein
MAQSIPPNLEVKTLNLKKKTKNKSNIQGNKETIKEKLHIPNGSMNTKILSVTSKWHVKSTLWKIENNQKKTQCLSKYMLKTKERKCEDMRHTCVLKKIAICPTG